jgi:hypothetical protein
MRNSQANEQTLALGSSLCQTWITSGRRTRCSLDQMERSSQVLDVTSMLPTTSVELGTTACWRGVLENASSSSKVEQVVDESESSIFHLLDSDRPALSQATSPKSELLMPLWFLLKKSRYMHLTRCSTLNPKISTSKLFWHILPSETKMRKTPDSGVRIRH